MFSSCLEKEVGFKKISALDGIIEVHVPSGWNEVPNLHRSADLQAGEEKTNQYLLIISELKKNTRFSNKEEYSEFTRKPIIDRLGEGFVFGPEKLTIQGHSALRYEIRGRSPHNNSVVYYHTVVETPRYYHQIVVWTSEKHFKDNKGEMIRITESFREN